MFEDNEEVSQEHPTQRLDNSAYEAPASGDTRRLIGGKIETNAARAPQPLCGECGGEMIVAKLGSYRFTVQAESGPHWRNIRESGVSVLVCSQCGFIKFYATDPDKLLE